MLQDLGEQMENKCYTLALKLLVIWAQCLWGWSPTGFHSASKQACSACFQVKLKDHLGVILQLFLMFLTWLLAFWLTLNLSACVQPQNLHKKGDLLPEVQKWEEMESMCWMQKLGNFTVNSFSPSLCSAFLTTDNYCDLIFFFHMGNGFLQYPI